MKVLTLFKKDLLLEARTKDSLILFILLSLLLSVVTAFAVRSAILAPFEVTKLYSGSLWLIFLFVATLVLSKAYDHEFEAGALRAIVLTGVSDLAIYCSKVIGSTILIFICHLFTILFLAIFLNVAIFNVLPWLALVSFLVVLGYCSLVQLFSLMTRHSNFSSLLLPLILIPLLFPLFFCGVELSSAIILEGNLSINSIWLSLLLALDVIYFVLGINLYRYVLV